MYPLGILAAGEVKENEDLKNLLMWVKFSFHAMVDREHFTYVKNKKYLNLIINKRFKIVNGAVWRENRWLVCTSRNRTVPE